ncbi:MAG TPA: 16S rRNA (guanine(527)-N(7))-methyltransferase RsmG [Pyrinomonadaceae bacterium]
MLDAFPLASDLGKLLVMPFSEQVTLFKQSLQEQMPAYGIDLSSDAQIQLAAYYELLLRWNERLHLVAPCSPEVFAGRHVLESLTLINHVPESTAIADVGSGAGLPILPCMIAKPNLKATLIESSQKKSVFLREALKTLELSSHAVILAKPFEQCETPAVDFVTSRALDSFTTKLPTLFGWAPRQSTLLLFGGENLKEGFRAMNCEFIDYLLPGSENRFLFEVKKA